MERMLKQFINIITFPLLFACALLLTACLNPTGVNPIPRTGQVIVYEVPDDPCDCCPPRIRGGDQRIYGLCNNRYYIVERRREGEIVGTFFVNREGILVDDLRYIGRVEGRIIHGWRDADTGVLIGLSNEERGYIYFVRHALPLRGYISFYPQATMPSFYITGEIHVRDPGVPGPTASWNAIDLFPLLNNDINNPYELVYIPIPGDTPTPITPLTGLSAFRVDLLRTQTHEGADKVDYLFVRRDRSRFKVLRAIPLFRGALTIKPVVIQDNSPVMVNVEVELTQGEMRAREDLLFALVDTTGFNPHSFRLYGEILADIALATGTVLTTGVVLPGGQVLSAGTTVLRLDFAGNPMLHYELSAVGRNSFTLIAETVGDEYTPPAPWSALLTLIVNP